MVGTAGFEPAAFGPPDRHANQAAPRPVASQLRSITLARHLLAGSVSLAQPRRAWDACPRRAAAGGCVIRAGPESYDVPGMAPVPCSLVVAKAMSPPHAEGAAPLPALGTRSPASRDGGFGSQGPTRPLPVRRRRRIAFRVAKILLAMVAIFAAAVGLLLVLTPRRARPPRWPGPRRGSTTSPTPGRRSRRTSPRP